MVVETVTIESHEASAIVLPARGKIFLHGLLSDFVNLRGFKLIKFTCGTFNFNLSAASLKQSTSKSFIIISNITSVHQDTQILRRKTFILIFHWLKTNLISIDNELVVSGRVSTLILNPDQSTNVLVHKVS